MGQTKNPDELSPVEAVQLLAKGVVDQIDKHLAALRDGLSKMQEREAEGAVLAKKSRSVFDLVKSDTLIDNRYRNDPVKRYKEVGTKGVGPLDKPQEEVSAEGSGGDIKKTAMPAVPGVSGAGPAAPAGKPSGVPGAPKPPQAPGAAPTMHKMDIPASTEKANGGPQPTVKAEKPDFKQMLQDKKTSDAAHAARAGLRSVPAPYSASANIKRKPDGSIDFKAMTPTKKMEIPSSTEKANGGPQPTKKMEMPTTPEKANGGPMVKAALSPVFAVRPRMGGKDPVSQQMTADASHASHQAHMQQQNTMALPKTTLPSVADHASRANYLASFGATGGHAMAPTRNAGGIDLPPDEGTVPEIHTGASQYGLAPAGKFGKGEMMDKIKAGARTKAEGLKVEHQDKARSEYSQHHDDAAQWHRDRAKDADKVIARTKITKAEMDSAKCPKCSQGMTLCKCYNSGRGQ